MTLRSVQFGPGYHGVVRRLPPPNERRYSVGGWHYAGTGVLEEPAVGRDLVPDVKSWGATAALSA